MAISVVQTAQNHTSTSSTSFSVTANFGSSTTSGNCIVACIASTGSNNNASVSGVQLGGANDNWASLTSFGNSAADSWMIFWADNNCAGGQTAVKVSVTGGGSGTNFLEISVFEISGLVASSLLDKSTGSGSFSSSSSWSSGTTSTLAQSNEIALGMVCGRSNTITGPGGGWTNLGTQTDGTVDAKAGYNIVSATSGLAYSGTFSVASIYGAGIITLKGASGGGGGAAGSVARQTAEDRRKRLRERPRARLAGQAPNNPISQVGVSAGLQGSTSFSGFTAPVSVTAVPGTVSGNLTLVQQVSGTSTYDYGLSTIPITSTTGNALILMAGWDLSTQPTSAAMPAVWVNDSAQNVWRHAATSGSSNSGSRCAIWIVTNAQSISWLSVSASSFVSSLAYTVIEISNMPKFYNLDVFATNSLNAGTTLALSAGHTTGGDLSFAVFTTGATGLTPATPSGWNALSTVTSGAGNPNPVQIFPYWQSTASGASLNPSWTVGTSAPLSGVVIGVSGVALAPPQPNPNFPTLKVEAAFGFLPGDPSQAPPSDQGSGVMWTDITQRAITQDGHAFISSTMGRAYELTTPEAGELTIQMNNVDGAFTPGNVNSPYYPNVLVGTPVRVTALWETVWYPVGFGYVERWPQEWPDLPQWGFSKMVAADAFAVLSSVSMRTALDGDMVLDAPYVFINASETYTVFSNGINSFFSNADSQGLLAANTSRVNQRNAMYVDGLAAPGLTGGTTQMLGDEDPGFGTGSIGTAPTIPTTSGPGIIYTDPNIPDPLDANGVSVEFWLIIPLAVASASLQPVVFQAFGPPSNYYTASPSLSVKINNLSGTNTLSVIFADGSSITAPFLPNQNTAQQIVLNVTSTGITVYINGGVAASSALTATQTTHWYAVSWGCNNYAYGSQNLTAGNFTVFDCVVYPYQLPLQRAVSHFATGQGGQQGVDATVRMAQILSWSGLGLPRAGQQTFGGVLDGVSQGPAYGLGGTAASDAIGQLAINHSTMVIAQPTGALQFIHRWALFNQTPAITFGDATSGISQYGLTYTTTYGSNVSEVPFLNPTSWAYDNTYLYNLDAISLQYGANVTLTVTVNDFNSQHSYFTRSALTETITTMSYLDVYDIANWQINKYSQPQLRVSGLAVDVASNTQFGQILTIQQGDASIVTRNPVGGASITESVLVQQLSHDIGPDLWSFSAQLSPYVPESSVLQLDTATFDQLGNGVLP